jgi:hypothetical protein
MSSTDLTEPPRPGVQAAGNAKSRFAEITARTPRSADAESAFMASKLHLLRTHPVAPERRAAMVRGFNQRLRAALPTELAMVPVRPVPGGVGYGVFYHQDFKVGFATGTAISFEIVCPVPPGGNVSDWLYLTATNRSSLGVEAFVAYHGQNDISFNVFDWARPGDQWQTHVMLDALGEYLSTDSANGGSFPVLRVMNTTLETSPGNWSNQVQLWNYAQSRWDLIYQFDYTATLEQQTSDWVGSWGPILETFQDAYSGTSPMGALKASVAGRDNGGTWSAWELLSPGESDVRIDNKGFVQEFLDANSSWVVQS